MGNCCAGPPLEVDGENTNSVKRSRHKNKSFKNSPQPNALVLSSSDPYAPASPRSPHLAPPLAASLNSFAQAVMASSPFSSSTPRSADGAAASSGAGAGAGAGGGQQQPRRASFSLATTTSSINLFAAERPLRPITTSQTVGDTRLTTSTVSAAGGSQAPKTKGHKKGKSTSALKANQRHQDEDHDATDYTSDEDAQPPSDSEPQLVVVPAKKTLTAAERAKRERERVAKRRAREREIMARINKDVDRYVTLNVKRAREMRLKRAMEAQVREQQEAEMARDRLRRAELELSRMWWGADDEMRPIAKLQRDVFYHEEEKVRKLQKLVQKGMNFDIADSYRYTPVSLWAAGEYDEPQCVQLLVDQGCNLERTNWDGYTALWLSVGRGHVDTVKVLLENGADPVSRSQQKSIVHEAVSRFFSEAQLLNIPAVLRLLGLMGIRMDEPDDEGRTALQIVQSPWMRKNIVRVGGESLLERILAALEKNYDNEPEVVAARAAAAAESGTAQSTPHTTTATAAASTKSQSPPATTDAVSTSSTLTLPKPELAASLRSAHSSASPAQTTAKDASTASGSGYSLPALVSPRLTTSPSSSSSSIVSPFASGRRSSFGPTSSYVGVLASPRSAAGVTSPFAARPSPFAASSSSSSAVPVAVSASNSTTLSPSPAAPHVVMNVLSNSTSSLNPLNGGASSTPRTAQPSAVSGAPTPSTSTPELNSPRVLDHTTLSILLPSKAKA